jgi:hypothetical protein
VHTSGRTQRGQQRRQHASRLLLLLNQKQCLLLLLLLLPILQQVQALLRHGLFSSTLRPGCPLCLAKDAFSLWAFFVLLCQGGARLLPLQPLRVRL